MIFPPYIAPPCNLPCCRPIYSHSLPRYQLRNTLTLARSITPPRPPPPPLPSSQLQNPYQTVPIIKMSTSMPGGLGIPNMTMSLPPDNQFLRTSQPNIFQTFGKTENSSITNLNTPLTSSTNSNFVDHKIEKRSIPYYYNELSTSSNVFDSNLNLHQRSEENLNNSKEEILNELDKGNCSEETLSNENSILTKTKIRNYKTDNSSGGDDSATINGSDETGFKPVPAYRNVVDNGNA